MANVNSLSSASSAASSLYGSRNVLSGLASGLDTEAMIENCVSGYQTKITQLEQKQTKVQWQQDAIREIIGSASSMATKYSSYTSSTNLSSSSFFTSASNTSTLGTYANLVSARGTSSSTVELSSVTKIATAATYGISLANIGQGNVPTEVVSNGINLTADGIKYNGAFTLTIQNGTGSKFTMRFDGSESYTDAEGLLSVIQDKMTGQTFTLEDASGNEQEIAAEEYFDVSVGADGKIAIGVKALYEDNGVSIKFKADGTSQNVTLNGIGPTLTLGEALAGQKLSVTVDGVTDTITLGALPDASSLSDLATMLQAKFSENANFSGKGIVVSADESSGTLRFSFSDSGHSLQIAPADGSPDFMENLLKFNSADAEPSTSPTGVNTTVNTKIGDLGLSGMTGIGTINGVEIEIGEDATIQDVLSAINKSKAGVTASYSKLTQQIHFTANETGAAIDEEDLKHTIKFGGDLEVLFGRGAGTADYKEGEDAQLTAVVNGKQVELTSKSNTVDMDGMQVTLKGTFAPTGAETGVTFGGSAESDKIVDAVKSFVSDFNKLVTSLRTAFTTQPSKQSNGKSYEPLTDDDKKTMSESAIKSYEETAKQGILFGDSDLSSMYTKLISQLTGNSEKRALMQEIGITTDFKDGLTTLTLDENKLRNALEGGVNKVKEVFNDSSYGANDGLVGRVKTVLDAYASTSTASQGILVRKAGTTLASYSLTNNTLQKMIDNYQTQIERWQTKMSSRVDYYTKQFSKLEQLMNQMNNQSSMLSGMMGG